MTPTPEYLPLPTIDAQWRDNRLRLAVAGDLTRYRGETRRHAESDLRAYLTWCAQRSLDPLTPKRPHVELYVWWMQKTRRYALSTVSRRMSIVTGFYRTAPASSTTSWSTPQPTNVRRPNVPPESPTLGSVVYSSRRCSPPHPLRPTRATSLSSACWGRSACASSKPEPWTSATSAENTATAFYE